VLTYLDNAVADLSLVRVSDSVFVTTFTGDGAARYCRRYWRAKCKYRDGC
ncbi:hypothetical protein MHK_006300, partial [Candidatus Magnetomorum sp. HK-1]